MSFFEYRNGELHAEQVSLSSIASDYGTPCYVYSRAAIEAQWNALDSAFGNHPHTICYAVKANSNIAVLNILARLGSGFDIVSEGELRRVLKAGGDPSKVVFSGVAKSRSELAFAMKSKVKSINIESIAELERVQSVAESLNLTASIAFRVNPDVDPETHPYISTGMDKAKFGVTMEAAFEAYKRAATLPNIEVHGIACHIGSQITKMMLTQVEYLKHNASKSFAIVDAGMNDLLRPALYQAFHHIKPVNIQLNEEPRVYDVVGPVCESACVLGYDRSLAVKPGDLLAVLSAGAYSFVMSNNYNSRKRPAEIMVDRETSHVIRQRETYDQLLAGESLLPE